MPYPAYSMMSNRDVADLWAYMQKIEPVKNRVVSNQLPFPFNVRLSLIGWNLLNFRPQEFVPDSSKSAEWNRGAYLVLGAGHCGACHTPKTLTGGDKAGHLLGGANLQGWVAPDISSDPHKGIGSWSSEDIISYLKTGANRFEIASGPMAEVVSNSTQFWTDDDLKSVAIFLKDSKGTSAPKPAPLRAEDPAMIAGRAIYLDRCAACHVGNGEGAPLLFPRLAKAPLVNGDDPTSLIRVVLEGSQAGATALRPTAPTMPSLAWNLGDEEVANVLTYIRNSWGNAAAPVKASSVKSLRGDLAR
jgi:mono/diheme cytochrome c family protein